MNKKILLIDDNKMLGKLLAKKIQTTLNHEVDIVFSLAEVKALPNDEYFLTFADLCLPDAPNGGGSGGLCFGKKLACYCINREQR